MQKTWMQPYWKRLPNTLVALHTKDLIGRSNTSNPESVLLITPFIESQQVFEPRLVLMFLMRGNFVIFLFLLAEKAWWLLWNPLSVSPPSEKSQAINFFTFWRTGVQHQVTEAEEVCDNILIQYTSNIFLFLLSFGILPSRPWSQTLLFTLIFFSL